MPNLYVYLNNGAFIQRGIIERVIDSDHVMVRWQVNYTTKELIETLHSTEDEAGYVC